MGMSIHFYMACLVMSDAFATVLNHFFRISMHCTFRVLKRLTIHQLINFYGGFQAISVISVISCCFAPTPIPHAHQMEVFSWQAIQIHLPLYTWWVGSCWRHPKIEICHDMSQKNSNQMRSCWDSYMQIHGFLKIIDLGLSENSVPLHPMVNDHYPY